MLIATFRGMNPTKTHALVKRLVPAVAVWAIGKALDTPRVKKRLQKVDERINERRVIAASNARGHKAWLAAGTAVCAIGLGMIVRAAKR